MSKHTPGTWRDQHFDGYTHIIRGPNDYHVCSTRAYSREVAAANARLIAAAPELLEVAKLVVEFFGTDPIEDLLDAGDNDQRFHALIRIRNFVGNSLAIANAEGA